MLNVCLTFDYELFLGRNFVSYDDVLFNPTEELLKKMDSIGVKGTFFADVCSSLFFKKNNPKAEFDSKFEWQVQRMISTGHDVELHIHPNWMKSSFDGKEVNISSSFYRIHDYGFGDGGEAETIIEETVNYINDICRKADKNYTCVAYRAGGFCLQPERELLSALRSRGIIIDSSITPHLHCSDKDNGHYFDYRKTPKKTANWWIDPNRGITVRSKKSQGSIFEVPILTFKASPSLIFGKRKKDLVLPPRKVNGSYVSTGKKNQIGRSLTVLYSKTLGRLFDYRTASLDSQKASFLFDVLSLENKRHDFSLDESYLSIICHPKLLDQTRIDNIAELVRLVKESQLPIRFLTMREIAERI